MALKAGTVGIDPKYVDKNGKPVSEAADLSNYYTKSETDTKLDLKANQSYLTANNKKFQFAYDSESGKYGYKAGAQDDFHPFESAGGIVGMNLPDAITTGLTYSNCEYVSGGYQVVHDSVADQDYLYADLIIHSTGSGYSSCVVTFPNEIGFRECVGVAYSYENLASVQSLGGTGEGLGSNSDTTVRNTLSVTLAAQSYARFIVATRVRT